MINHINRFLNKWCKKQDVRPILLISPSYPHISIKHEERQIWLPICSFLVIFLVYGVYQNLYQLAILATKFNPSLLINILALIFGVSFILACLYGVMYIQNHSVHTMKISRHNWWINVLEGIFCACILPTITAMILDIIFKIKPHATTNQSIINKMLSMHGLAFFLIVLSSVVLGPIIEEILFRFLLIGPSNFNGYVYKKDLRAIMIFISMLFFAYEHLNPEFSMIDWSSQYDVLMLLIDGAKYFIMGLVFTYIYLRTDDIRASIATHIGYNIIGTIIQFTTMLF